MNLVLALDTSTPAVTAGIVRRDDLAVLAERVTVDARAHAERLTPNVLAALADAELTMADLDAVVVGCGPGPFTGLRAGMSTAAAYGHALGIPVHGVCSLDAIGVRTTGDTLVVTDARRREVYWARYDAAGRRLDGPAVGFPADVAQTVTEAAAGRAAGSPGSPGVLTAGAGALLYPDVLGEPIEPSYPAAGTLAGIAAQQLAAGEPGSGAEPIYLRRPDARVPGPPKRVTVP